MTGPRDANDARDDVLAAMLEARADRMAPSAGREVMAAVRDEMRAPAGQAGFAVLPVLAGGRASKAPAGWVAIGMVAVLVLAVMGGRLTTGPARPPSDVATAGPSASPGAVAASTEPATQVAAPPAIPSRTMRQLGASLAAGTLDGQTILVTGRLEVQPYPCPSRTDVDCPGLRLRGLDGVEIDHAGVLTAAQAFARISGDSVDRPMAFRVTGGHLGLLGWITQGAATPLTVEGLVMLATAPSPPDLAIVSGWVRSGSGGPACPSPAGEIKPCDSGPILSDEPPVEGGNDRAAVSVPVSFGVPGTASLAEPALAGPFLVQQVNALGGDQPQYRVVATLDPATTVLVVPGDSLVVMTPALLEAAVASGSMDGQLIAITSWLQPSRGQCPADLAQPCVPYAILGLDVLVTWDGYASTISRLDNGVLRPPSDLPDTIVVTPREGRLVLFGRLTGSLDDPPPTLPDLLSRRGLARLSDPLALTAVAGWLVVGGVHSCPALGPGATPCPGPGPLLTDKEPSPDGVMMSDLQQPVQVWPDAVGIHAALAVTQGPFLVRQFWLGMACADGLGSPAPCGGSVFAQWQVVALDDVGGMYRVTVP